ncbi:hypothetical protein J1614_003006 [Plenodomus biglobosus]|nr:hypothetical protein J1614_003006 [Plenodomus biglobosus]
MQALMEERDFWKSRANHLAALKETLGLRLSSKEVSQCRETDVIRRMERLQQDNIRLRTEVSDLKENLKDAKSENATLCNENDGKARKLKGANKKVKNAKEIAGKEEEKAKGAMSDKQRRHASERKMKKERNDALAALQEQTRINEDLRAQLAIEQSGAVHLRDTATDPNNTTVIIPIELDIRRIDFTKVLPGLQATQMTHVENSRRWYEEWKTHKEEVRKVIGADYVVDDKKKETKIYEDFIEMSDGYMETGAEHDGKRSKRELEAICRRSEATHNEGDC